MSENTINNAIESAYTLPGSFYTDEEIFDSMKEKVFARSWQLTTTTDSVKTVNSAYPFFFMPDFLEEPLLLTRNEDDQLNCISNVCTHRGNILIQNATSCRKIVCGYHGRKFDMTGQFESMPSFKDVENFPSETDNLTKIPFSTFRQFIFTSLSPAYSFSEITEVLERKVGFLDFGSFTEDPSKHRIYLVKAHWALYCDNYLEGFHIPFVHPGLNQVLDAKDYTTELHRYLNIQIGIAEEGVEAFDLPPDHEDHGKRIAAYYFWIFPNLMLNFYPWGLSVNIVRPQSINRTKVEYLTFVLDPNKVDNSAGAELDKVEREDEDIVESVQRGIGSRFYSRGRFSPTMEKGVHHFHQLLSEFFAG